MDRSPLGTLPPELRARIFRLALHPENDSHVDLFAGDAPLSRTCQQLRDETLSMYYSLNTRMSIRIPPYIDFAACGRLQTMADAGKLDFLQHLRIYVVYAVGARRGPDSRIRTHDQCIPIAALLHSTLGLRHKQVEWVCGQFIDLWGYSDPTKDGMDVYLRYGGMVLAMRALWARLTGSDTAS